jgi:UPF0716 family protein affecting phage T7 exclusion
VVDAALVLAGGVLIMIPGFITDGIGLLLVLAPSRALARAALIRNFQSRLVVTATRFSRAPRSPYDVDSTATDLDRPQLHG